MMNQLKKWIKDTCTEPNGETICPVRILAIAGFVWALSMSGWSVFALKAVFDITAFGTAYGIMLGALGVALGFKTDTKDK